MSEKTHGLHVIPGGKDKDIDSIEQHFEKILASRWFRIIGLIYLLISAGGFPILLCLYICHYLGK